jgi:hypothetical protein
MAKTRRAYTGGAVSTTTTSSIAASGATSFTITAGTGWPYGTDPFYIVVEPGTASEEKMLVTRTGVSDLTINIASDSVRGLDGTAAVSHGSGVTTFPVFTAVDADEANELTSKYESKGDLVSHGAATFERLAVGTNEYVLRADSSTASGLAWGLVDTANLATDAVTAAKIAAGAVDSAELASGAVTVEKLAAAVAERLVPAGTVVATVATAADTGWLLMGQTVTDAQTSYPALWTVAPSAWKSGSSLVLPSMSDRVLAGSGATALGASGGANTVTIASGNLPTHVHAIDHDHAVVTSSGQSQGHIHKIDPPNTTVSISDPGHSHTSGVVIRQNAGTFGGAASGHGGGATTTSASANVSSSSTGITASVNIAEFDSKGTSQDHTHTVNLPNFTGSSGNGGFANTALNVRNAHVAVNFQIKAH